MYRRLQKLGMTRAAGRGRGPTAVA
jgi:hypothetical protein